MKTIERLEEHKTLHGQAVSLADLDDEARQVLEQLHVFLDSRPDWTVFGGYWPPKVLVKKPASRPDYREQLAEITTSRFCTRRDFCQATGIAEDLLSHVLAGRKHLAIDTLTAALERIGYRLQIVPMDKK